MSMRFTRPASSPSAPMGTCTAAALCLSLALSCPSTRHGSAPVRSSLLIKARRGTLGIEEGEMGGWGDGECFRRSVGEGGL